VALGQVGRLAHGVCGLPPQVGRRYLRAYTHPNTSFVQRADMWRYARLLTQGGVYADGDASPTPAFLGEYARHISEGGEIWTRERAVIEPRERARAEMSRERAERVHRYLASHLARAAARGSGTVAVGPLCS